MHRVLDVETHVEILLFLARMVDRGLYLKSNVNSAPSRHDKTTNKLTVLLFSRDRKSDSIERYF